MTTKNTLMLALVALTFGVFSPAPASAALYINEFMADNDGVIEDPDEPGAYEDWLEIYNSGDVAVDISGMYLTDDLANPTQWQVPPGVSIPAGGYLLFWADGEDLQGDTHTNFKLGAGGEEIGLYDTDGLTAIDSIVFGPQVTDVSYGRYPDGLNDWDFMATSTPGSANEAHNPPPTITATAHAPLLPTSSDLVWVACTVTDDSAVNAVTLSYDAGGGWIDISMYDDGLHNDAAAGDGTYGGQIPTFADGTVVDYYVTAVDDLAAEITDPVGVPLATYSYMVGYQAPPLYINEFMADNDATIEDPDEPGAYEDWIEIYNAGGSPVDLNGMYLTDDLSNPTKWPVPASVVVPPGGYVLFWADEDEEQGQTHTNFRLGAGGEEIGLYDTDANGKMPIDTLAFGVQTLDVSYGRCPDGSESWEAFTVATPGAADGPCGGILTTTTATTSPTTTTLPAECAPAPATGCVGPAKGALLVKETVPGKEKVKVVLNKLESAVNRAQFGDPVFGTTSYAVCIYDDADVLVGQVVVNRAQSYCGTPPKPCWKRISYKGYKYQDKNASADGILNILAKGGAPGKGKVVVLGKNNPSKGQFSLPTGIAALLQNKQEATVQVVTSDADCFGVTATDVKKADGFLFKARGG